VKQTYSNWVETHIGVGDTNAFVIPSAANAWLLPSTFITSTALMKCPQRFWSHSFDGCPSVHRNPHLWQRCGNVVSAIISFWLPWLARTWQHGHHMTCALIGMSCKLAAFNYTSSLVLWTMLEYGLVDANGGIRRARVEPATRSAVATCYTQGRKNCATY